MQDKFREGCDCRTDDDLEDCPIKRTRESKDDIPALDLAELAGSEVCAGEDEEIEDDSTGESTLIDTPEQSAASDSPPRATTMPESALDTPEQATTSLGRPNVNPTSPPSSIHYSCNSCSQANCGEFYWDNTFFSLDYCLYQVFPNGPNTPVEATESGWRATEEGRFTSVGYMTFRQGDGTWYRYH